MMTHSTVSGKGPTLTTGCTRLWHCLLLVGPVLTMVGLACLTTAIATTHWLEKSSPSGQAFHGGLFKFCRDAMCAPYEDSSDEIDMVYLKVSIATLIMAAFGYLIAFFVMSYFVVGIVSGNSVVSWTGQTSWLAACVINATGISTFVKFQAQTFAFKRNFMNSLLREMDYGYSFHLSWTALVLLACGSMTTCLVALCCAKVCEEEAPIDKIARNRIREAMYKQKYSQPVLY